MIGTDSIALKQTLDALERALEQPETERVGWLAALDKSDPALASRVRALLTAHSGAQAAGFMRDPLRLPVAMPDEPTAGAAAALASGDAIGPYRLVRELGAGGMGVVWLAERADGLFKRPVALKLPHVGPHASALAERFAREREILAALEHPHIARLYDAGVTASGQPYLAIEYVEGEPLTRYCDARALGVAARIRLFIDVLHAVQYAHGQLVVHRDLKPANILVTREGRVLLLDFGIARLLATDNSTQETSLTQVGGRALTPDYASPEQIMGGTIGTASDIYSLGVVLHELLIGRRPYKLKRNSPAALEEAIVAVDVQRASDAEMDRDTARARASDPQRLRKQLRGDLDTIILAAMAKTPPQRYTTCAAFAEDLQRHLNGRPLLAQPEPGWQRAAKFVRRHRFSVGATAAVAIAVIAGAGVALLQAAKAREEAARADAIRTFVVNVFEHNSASQSDPERARATTVRQLLDGARDELLKSPPAEPIVAQTLLATFSDLYFQIGLAGDSLRLDRARLDLTRKAFGELDARTLEAQRDVAQVLLNQGTADEEMYALATDLIAKLDRRGDHETLLRAQSEGLLAETLVNRGDEAAFEHQRRAVELLGRRYSDNYEYPISLGNFARSQGARGDVRGARDSIAKAIEAWRNSPAANKNNGSYLFGIAGQIHEANDDLRSAEAALREASRLELEVHDPASWQINMGWVRSSRLLTQTGRAQAVLQSSADVLLHARAARDAPPWFIGRAHSLALLSAVESGDAAATSNLMAQVQRIGCRQDDDFTDMLCREALLDAYRLRGDRPAVLELLAQIEQAGEPSRGRRPVMFVTHAQIALLTAVARAQIELGQVDQAARSLRRAREQLTALQVQPVLTELRLGAAERALLIARGEAKAAKTLTENLRQRIATHPDRELLAVYERALHD